MTDKVSPGRSPEPANLGFAIRSPEPANLGFAIRSPEPATYWRRYP